MTNEKAIDLLRRMQEPEAYEPQITEEAFEALELAIRALGTDKNVGTTDVPDINIGELISRQAAINALREYMASKMFALLTKPTEGPKRGKWVTDIEVAGEKGVGCDQCKTFFAYNYGGKKHNFCPQCGADMREERNLNEQM